MTPNDILNKRFERAAVGGYRADDVNGFMLNISDFIEELQAENGVYKDKLVMLADELQKYQADEDSMRSALLGAQKLGDTIVKESKEKSEKIIEDAVQESETLISNAKNEATKITHESKIKLETENYSLSKIQREVAKFKKQILALYQQQIELVGAIPYEEENLAPSLPNPLRSNISKRKEEQEYRNKSATEKDSTKEKYSESNFEPLEFGDGFKVED